MRGAPLQDDTTPSLILSDIGESGSTAASIFRHLPSCLLVVPTEQAWYDVIGFHLPHARLAATDCVEIFGEISHVAS
jgi:hypothetical protein